MHIFVVNLKFKRNIKKYFKKLKIDSKIIIPKLPDLDFSLMAQSRALCACSVNGGCSGLKVNKLDLPSKLTVSSCTLNSVIPLALKNLAAKLVPTS